QAVADQGVVGPARRGLALCGQYGEAGAGESLPTRRRRAEHRPGRAFPLALLGPPRQAILLGSTACRLLPVFSGAVLVVIGLGVFELRIAVGEDRLDRLVLVAADLARGDFLLAGRQVERPA